MLRLLSKASVLALAVAGASLGGSVLALDAGTNALPNGWLLLAPTRAPVETGTMPQGAALSPDGATLAVVESGFNPPALAFFATADLHLVRRVPLSGAFGRPVWTTDGVLVAGANADAIFVVNAASGAVRKVALPAKSYPVSLAARNGIVAVSSIGDGALRVGKLAAISQARAIAVGRRPGAVAFSDDGSAVFVAIRAASNVARVTVRSGNVTSIPTGLHPSDLLVRGRTLFVAESDADSIGAYDVATGARLGETAVGTIPGAIGASPNSLAIAGDTLYASLGAANEVVAMRAGAVVRRFPAGWYPTAVVPAGRSLFVVNGKGEGTKPNPEFNYVGRDYHQYVAAIQYGSIRRISLDDNAPANPQGAAGYDAVAPADTVVRAGGPIQHVFFILKENRSYDQVLGDMPAGNGDPKLVFFGENVTPNQHELARRFGLFDNFFASGEVSDAGHNWADAAFVNDYAERTWPPSYGRRFDDDDVLTGEGPATPAKGYIWDAAREAGINFRDYGEMALFPSADGHPASTAPTLGDRFDPKYVSWNLDYSDLDREKEWQREFEAFDAAGTVPQLEWIWLPNDHTYGSRAGKPTPTAFVATNDYAVGLMVQAIAHSKVWKSSAIFITEDDAQDGADHVSDQRTTLYVVSPYARAGAIHDHYSTVSVVRTIELLLGLKPMSAYDTSAVPLYQAFGTTPNLDTYAVIAPRVDLTGVNQKTAYGERRSELADFSRPDAVPPAVLNDILAHNH